MKNKSVIILLLLLLVFPLLFITVSGCSPITISEDQRKQLLSYDPDFQKILDVKNKLDVQLADLRAEFLSEKNIYESKAAALRNEFETKRTRFYTITQQIKSQLNLEREKIKLAITNMSEQLKDKNKNIKAVQDMFRQSKSIMEGKFGGNLQEKDKLEWQKRYESLSEESAVLAKEISDIKEKLYILKLKQRSLIQ